MPMTKLRELRDRRGDNAKQARAILDRAEGAGRDLTPEEKADWDKLIAQNDKLRESIEIEERQLELEREMAGKEFQRISGNGQETAGEPGWRDFRTGQRVRVLRADQKLCETDPGSVGFGAYLRGMALGPTTAEERQTLIDAAGGVLVPSPISGMLIDKVRDDSILIASGALTIPMDSAELTLVKIAEDPATAWHLQSVEIPESSPAFGAVMLRARTLTSLVRVSRELLVDAPNTEKALLMAFSGKIASTLDAAFLNGAGASGEPTGLLGMSEIPKLSLADNGAPITYDSLLSGLGVLWSAGAVQPTAFVANPRDILALAGLKDLQGNYLRPPQQLSSIKYLQSNGLPVDQAHGTASNASTGVLGDFRQVIIGVRAQLELSVLRERYAEFYEVGFLVSMRVDFAVTQGARFVLLTGIVPPSP